MNRDIILYKKIKEVYDNLLYLVEPSIIEDIRSERNTLKDCLELLEDN